MSDHDLVKQTFNKLLVANRGEIACRIIRTARRMGVETVAIYSEADTDALHVRMADESVFIGASKAAQSYLNIEKIISAAKSTNSGAIHPGYGFLSENPEFVRQCDANKIVFVGPSVEAIEKMGIKDTAKSIARQCKIPVLAGYEGDNQEPDYLLQQAEQIGFPVMIKAVAGGGGKGLKIVEDKESFFLQLESARREAGASFGNEKMMLEQYLADSRHIEIQIFADRHDHVVSLFERDCSIQRRHQKILEEAPAPDYSTQLRAEMGEAACSLAKFIGYAGAGTVEFLVDTQGQYFFLEMNTRLQVEHAITEAITGIDLVEWQLLVAAGAELPLQQEEIVMRGHAIEARLCAENVAADFLPSTGTIEFLSMPEASPEVRIDMGYDVGDSVSPYYDSLLAKLIVWGTDRENAVNTMRNALSLCLIAGIDNNANYLQCLVSSDAYRQAEIDTGFVSNFVASQQAIEVDQSHWAVAAVAHALDKQNGDANHGWRLNGANRLRIGLKHKEAMQQVYLTDATGSSNGRSWEVSVGNQTFVAEVAAATPDRVRLIADEKLREFRIVSLASKQLGKTPAAIVFFEGNIAFNFQLADRVSDCKSTRIGVTGASGSHYQAPMNGTISAILVAPAVEVEANTVLMVVEAMKMEFPILSQHKGTVSEFYFTVGDSVEQGQTLLELKEC